MQLLDIKLPTINRFQYANLTSKEIWEKKIELASRASKQIEFLSLKYGVRKGIYWEIDPMNLENVMQSLSRQNFVLVPLESINKLELTDKFVNYKYKVVIADSISTAEEFLHAQKNKDFSTIEKITKIPQTSLSFVEDNKEYSNDFTWLQTENTHSLIKIKRTTQEDGMEKHLIRLKFGDEQYKIISMLQKFGISIIKHTPSSFNCEKSLNLANELIDLAENLHLKGINEILEIQQLPFEWDCLKGVATINTPVFKFVTNSLTCYPNYVVQRESEYYPKEAPNGVKFPWKFPWDKK